MSVSLNSLNLQDKKKEQRIVDPLSVKRLYTIEESAKYLAKGVYSIRELIWQGKLPVVRDGRKQLIDRLDLDAYILKCKSHYSLREADERPENGRRKQQ
ncbi:MAG: helix-turn-helix domain-containing protein [Syntrophales bacterium LBB04]|nr:helix-turn-helix domain-containing protein [Syntrophales bacterium LBB04]